MPTVPDSATLTRPLTLASCMRAMRLCNDAKVGPFAQRLGITAGFLERVERGVDCPSDKEAERWARVLGVEPRVFVIHAQRLRMQISGRFSHRG